MFDKIDLNELKKNQMGRLMGDFKEDSRAYIPRTQTIQTDSHNKTTITVIKANYISGVYVASCRSHITYHKE